jgi:alpha-beta hydrolase superfamily lysophospholipase
MTKIPLAPLIAFILLLNACAAAPSAASTEPLLPSPEPSQTSTVLPVTPLESAFAPGNPTAAPAEEIIASHEVTFETPDGATITGELYGSGKTAVIFSVMGNCKPGWREFAQLTAAQGIMALTYPWRGCIGVGAVDNAEIQKFVDDLRGAINFVRGQGAEKVILAGASLGGVASAKLAAESGVSGLVVMASPAEIADWGFKIDSKDLDTDIPKLFITAQKDDVVSPNKTRELFDLAAEPKEWQVYPGTAHGTDLFDTENGKAVQDRVLAFILAVEGRP